MRVYVVEVGEYDDRYIAGVYATPEQAQEKAIEYATGEYPEVASVTGYEVEGVERA